MPGESAWTPKESTYYEALTIDLESPKRIYWMATRGRSNTLEFVTEFVVQYSDDGQQWVTLTDARGDHEVN